MKISVQKEIDRASRELSRYSQFANNNDICAKLKDNLIRLTRIELILSIIDSDQLKDYLMNHNKNPDLMEKYNEIIS